MEWRTRWGSLAILVVLGLGGSVHAAEEVVERVQNCSHVLREIQAIPEKAIPPRLLGEAQGIAIIPSVIKIGFVLGGRFGKGVVLVRQDDGVWSPPVLVQLAGGSVGWQIGAQSTDVVAIFKTRRGVESLLSGKLTLGADAAVAAGPVGRDVSAATDAKLQAEVLSYSRSRGLFAGVSLDGSVLTVDSDANEVYYRKDGVTPADISKGRVAVPPSA
ncbi:MAG: lipid-binding SYLF domain-containing protein [Deltaproteobacteria bacterium]|nr:lipid-binding SYLF domain-containing protein [Deltaproteobacteria bacterium]